VPPAPPLPLTVALEDEPPRAPPGPPAPPPPPVWLGAQAARARTNMKEASSFLILGCTEPQEPARSLRLLSCWPAAVISSASRNFSSRPARPRGGNVGARFEKVSRGGLPLSSAEDLQPMGLLGCRGPLVAFGPEALTPLPTGHDRPVFLEGPRAGNSRCTKMATITSPSELFATSTSECPTPDTILGSGNHYSARSPASGQTTYVASAAP
jgi:hypothetical protein